MPAEDRVHGRNTNAYDARKEITAADREAFIEKLKPSAIRLNKELGVPASVLLAMAMLESGCGLTRTAIFANNLFGIKQPSGAGTYQLIGQPAEDDPPNANVLEKIDGDDDRVIYDEQKRRNNRYKVFRTEGDSLEYLAKSLLQNSRYRPAITQYQTNLWHGMSPLDAAGEYAKDIGDRGYHHLRGTYYKNAIIPQIQKYKLYLLDLQAVSNAVNSSSQTRAAGENSPAAASSLPSEAVARVEAYWRKHLPSYMEGKSEPISYPRWEGFPTRLHKYRVNDGKTAEVIMCNPTANQLARWVVATCLEARGSASESLTSKLSQQILTQSGAQFPVAGIVLEDMNGPAFEVYPFRDGVTVRIQGIDNGAKTQPTNEQITRARDAKVPPEAALSFARLQGTTRDDYKAAGGREDVTGLRWLEVSRKLYQAAWGHDHNELMVAWAKRHL